MGTTVESAAEAVRNLGFVVTPEALALLAKEVGETTILSRTGERQHLQLVWLILFPKSLTAVP